ncbi:unnamed protein product [Arctogadus glacialis]
MLNNTTHMVTAVTMATRRSVLISCSGWGTLTPPQPYHQKQMDASDPCRRRHINLTHRRHRFLWSTDQTVRPGRQPGRTGQRAGSSSPGRRGPEEGVLLRQYGFMGAGEDQNQYSPRSGTGKMRGHWEGEEGALGRGGRGTGKGHWEGEEGALGRRRGTGNMWAHWEGEGGIQIVVQSCKQSEASQVAQA